MMGGLYDSRLLDPIFRRYLRILLGFNWGRFIFLNRTLWYVLFALALKTINNLKKQNIKLLIISNQCKIKYHCKKWFFTMIMLLIFCLQLKNVMASKILYNDTRATWAYAKHKIFAFLGSKEDSDLLNNDAYLITFNEFLSPNLFSKIKEDLNYTDEKVAAFGFHPSILVYNGFNCIDGYNSFTPLAKMQQFRKIIAPELAINKWAKDYYDNWGGRMYLFNSELSYEPTRNKNTVPVKLNIDGDVFKHDFNGKYILSRAEISNADSLGLKFVNRYYDNDSIYTIYLYETS
jgi:hypothetical protein